MNSNFPISIEAKYFARILVSGVDPDDIGARANSFQDGWAGTPGLRNALLHQSVLGDALIQYLMFEDSDALAVSSAPPRDRHEDYRSDAVRLTPGPDRHTDDFALVVDIAEARPVLLSIMRCLPEAQVALLDYLVASAACFRDEFRGWIGAALLPVKSGTAVIEYLQFESFEALAVLKNLPIIADHKDKLAAFGAMDAIIMMPIATWSSSPSSPGDH
jgi:hypothetical protein